MWFVDLPSLDMLCSSQKEGGKGEMAQAKGMKSIIPSKKAIGFMVLRGFGMFLSVTGMAGITLVLGPLDRILIGLEFTPIFESKGLAFLFCFLSCVVGGALDFFANLGLKNIEENERSLASSSA